MPKDLLVEIGVEDLPPHTVDALCEQLTAHTREELEAARLTYASIAVWSAPRRVVLQVAGVAEAQPSRTLEVKGPPKQAAFDADGNPTKAAEGFCKGKGADVQDAYIKEIDGGEYLFLTLHEQGQPAERVLQDTLPKALGRWQPTETMRWDAGLRFVRPVRWLLALLGEAVVAFEWAGLTASNQTWGHRFSSRKKLSISSAADYFAQLTEEGVMVDPQQRQHHIVDQLQDAAASWSARCEPSPKFLHQLVHCAEHPSAVTGGFSERFLSLPAEVLSTTMINHQRYVPCYHKETGEILPHFVGFRDGAPTRSEAVQRGYEWVLEARLEDSEFFFAEDRKRSLEQYVGDLKSVIYQEKLGSVWDKTERIRALANALGRQLGVPDAELPAIDRAAYLCKTDLVTLMVGEFPELQGVMGRLYASLDGEPQPVADAIGEHYLPQAPDDPLPATRVGQLLSLADKLDTVAGSLLIGQKPTSSRDPFGLRRAANAIIRLTLQLELNLDLFALLREQLPLYEFLGETSTTTEIEAFFSERLLHALRGEHGVPYDLAETVAAAAEGGFVDVLRKARSLQAMKGSEDFVPLVQAFSRANNILTKRADEVPDGFDPNLFAEEAETDLWKALLKTETRIERSVSEGAFGEILDQLLTLRAPIDHYFEHVMVMAEDDAVRRNRLGFLNAIRQKFALLGDWSKIVIEGEQDKA